LVEKIILPKRVVLTIYRAFKRQILLTTWQKEKECKFFKIKKRKIAGFENETKYRNKIKRKEIDVHTDGWSERISKTVPHQNR
jgi:hypothetical protein